MKIKLPKKKNVGEETFELQLRAMKIPFERECVFHPTRKWRIDFVVPAADEFRRPIAIEIDGILKQGGGGHQTFEGITSQCEKRNEMACMGYITLVVTPKQVKAGQAIQWVERVMGAT